MKKSIFVLITLLTSLTNSMSAHADTQFPVYNKTGYDLAVQAYNPLYGEDPIYKITSGAIHYFPADKHIEYKIMVGACDISDGNKCKSYKKLYKCTPLMESDEVRSITINSLTSCTIVCHDYSDKSCLNPWDTK
jgi:hypothetical protein